MKEFSIEIQNFLDKYYPNVDIENMSLTELKKFKDDVTHRRQEYALLENGTKILANAAYGACASPYFTFFNAALAADITGECRELTKTMWRNLEEFFHETIWERKDLQEQFGFELDESKHDWYREQKVSIYADTDSLDKYSLLLIKYKNTLIKMNIEDCFKFVKELNVKTFINENESEFVYTDKIKVLNYKDGKLDFVPIKWIMRHKVTKPKYRLITKSGKEIIVTNDHSCIVFRNGKQMEIKAQDINIKTDKILTVKYNNEKEK